jgi:hypothetical protein
MVVLNQLRFPVLHFLQDSGRGRKHSVRLNEVGWMLHAAFRYLLREESTVNNGSMTGLEVV